MNQPDDTTSKLLEKPLRPKQAPTTSIGFYVYPIVISSIMVFGFNELGRRGLLQNAQHAQIIELEQKLKKIEASLKRAITSADMETYFATNSQTSALEEKISSIVTIVEAQTTKIHELEENLAKASTKPKQIYAEKETNETQPETFIQKASEILTFVPVIEMAARKGQDFSAPLAKILSFCQGMPEMAENIQGLKEALTSRLATDSDLLENLHSIHEKLSEATKVNDEKGWLTPILSLVSVKKKGGFNINEMADLIRAGKLWPASKIINETAKIHPKIAGDLAKKLNTRIRFDHYLNSIARKLKRRMVFVEDAEHTNSPK